MPYLAYVMEAFNVLSAGRHWAIGMASVPMPLSFADIDRYAQRLGIVEMAEFSRFHSLLRALDREYMAHVTKGKDKGNVDDGDRVVGTAAAALIGE